MKFGERDDVRMKVWWEVAEKKEFSKHRELLDKEL